MNTFETILKLVAGIAVLTLIAWLQSTQTGRPLFGRKKRQ